ncbi:MAG: hypothetical protein QM496_14395 [Verrucomicrobiota bacterium]
MPSLRLIFIVCILATGLSQAEKQNFSRREQNKAFHHKQTDVILPREIADFKIREISRYGNSDFAGDDISLRFIDDHTKIDVYFYLGGDKQLEDDKNHQAIINEIGETLSVITQLAAKGKTYSEVKTSDSAQIYNYADDLTMIRSVMSYRQVNPKTGKFDQDKLESSVAITIYANYLIKIRHSFSIPADKKQLEQQRKKRQEFRLALCQLIADTEIRPEIKNALKSFQEKPQEDDSISAIIAYAEASELVKISLNAAYLPFLVNENFKAGHSLVAAYMAGNIEAQLTNLDFESHDLEGLEQMFRTYQLLKKIEYCRQ